MPLEIVVPESPFTIQDITLGGFKYDFTYAFNTRDDRWRFDIVDADNNPVITGVKIMENQDLLGRYILPGFSHGGIFCIRVLETTDPVGRNNLGSGLPYSLFYFTNEELSAL
jgi:hypothetical protein